MATLVDGVSWQAGTTCSLLSSVQRPDLSIPPCSCNRHSQQPPTTTRCASSNNLIDRLDPPLPRFPNRQQSTIERSRVSRYQVILENKPNWNQSYFDEGLTRSHEPSLHEPWNNLEKPSSPGNGDTTNKHTLYTDGQEPDMRRSQRTSPSYLSMSQSRRAMANGGATFQAVSPPLRLKDLKGPSGFYVGFATIMLGLMAVLQKSGFLGINNPPTTLCSNCYGYGTKPCKLCKGRGSVTWEGKLKHTDLCPSCFGARIHKCSNCGGYRMRSDEPPFLQQWSSRSRP